MMYNYGFYSPFHFLSSFVGWLIVFVIILMIFKAGKGKGHHMNWQDFRRDPAMDLLRERYVKGEISKDEFESKKKDLTS